MALRPSISPCLRSLSVFGSFQCRAVPMAKIGCGDIHAAQVAHQVVIRRLRLTDRVVGQDMLPEVLVVVGSVRSHWRQCKALRLGIGVAIKGSLAESPIARPEAAAADFMRVGFLHDPGAQVRRVARQARCRAAGEAGDCHVEAAPEEMHRTHLAEELPPEPGKDPFHLDQDLPEPRDIRPIIGGMRSIMLEWDGIRYLDWHGPDPGLQPEPAKPTHQLHVEIRDGSRTKTHGFDVAFGRLKLQDMIDEIEIDLKTLTAVRDW